MYEPILADPSVVRSDDGSYYAYGTEDDWGDCEGARIAPIVKSENLVDWEYVGEAFEAKPDWKNLGFIWAPDVVRYRDRYYLYYSYSEWGDEDPGIGVATATDPVGPFDDHGKLFSSEEIDVENSIDPAFHVSDGTPYLIWGSFHGIYGVELTEDGLDWVEETRFHVAGDAYEAPYLLEHDEYYYLFVTTGSCCDGHASTYELEVGRAESFEGPYENRDGDDLRTIDAWNSGEPIVSASDRFAGPGHNSTITDGAGTDWLLYHAYDTTADEYECDSFPRRSLLLDRIEWEDGWPTIDDGTPSEEATVPDVDV
ncbi:family 43 glycosylhydrolase [Halomontanus rarus]|uniref:family 43 glycosylhydrolase n=1 Tax=Halomontanus rarus TaxID=3034020 RepID=UPI001A992243